MQSKTQDKILIIKNVSAIAKHLKGKNALIILLCDWLEFFHKYFLVEWENVLASSCFSPHFLCCNELSRLLFPHGELFCWRDTIESVLVLTHKGREFCFARVSMTSSRKWKRNSKNLITPQINVSKISNTAYIFAPFNTRETVNHKNKRSYQSSAKLEFYKLCLSNVESHAELL